jgi:hypothetical protein
MQADASSMKKVRCFFKNELTATNGDSPVVLLSLVKHLKWQPNAR